MAIHAWRNAVVATLAALRLCARFRRKRRHLEACDSASSAIIPAAFASTYPVLDRLNVMHLTTPASAILSAVIFNALIIVALIPLALRGVKYRPVGAARLLRDNLLYYGLGGLIVPFIGIKLIDLLLAGMRIV
jgi:K+-transporting ATPase ATPase B chain